MEVIWKGDICLESGRQKLTLEVPPECEDEFFMLKKAARSGKKISLGLAEGVDPSEDSKPLIAMILDFAEKKYQEGFREATAHLLQEQEKEQQVGLPG